MKKTFLLFLFVTSFSASAMAEVSLCHENVSVFPWIVDEDEGLALKEVSLIEEDLKIKIKKVRLPWNRCLMEARAGRIDGLIAASYNEERASWGVYPTLKNGNLDRNRRMHTDSFYVYVRKDSNISYSNGKFHNLGDNQIGVQLGYSVGKDLKDMGHSIHEAFNNPHDLLKQMNMKMLNVAVLQNHETLRILSLFPDFHKTVKKIDPPFKIKDQYILFNRPFYEKNQQLVHSIWKSLEKARKSKAYQDYEHNLLSKVQ